MFFILVFIHKAFVTVRKWGGGKKRREDGAEGNNP